MLKTKGLFKKPGKSGLVCLTKHFSLPYASSSKQSCKMSAWVKETAQLHTCGVWLRVMQIMCSVADPWRGFKEVIGPQSQLVLSVITSRNRVLVPAGSLVLWGDWQRLMEGVTEMGSVRTMHPGCLPFQRAWEWSLKLRWAWDPNADHVYN